MNVFPRMKLRELLTVYGASLYQDPALCKRLLYDTCSSYPDEIEALLFVLNTQSVGELLRAGRSVTYPALQQSLVMKLQQVYAMPEAKGRWAIDSWASALGILADTSEWHGTGPERPSLSETNVPTEEGRLHRDVRSSISRTTQESYPALPVPPPPPPSSINNPYLQTAPYPPYAAENRPSPEPKRAGRYWLIGALIAIVVLVGALGAVVFARSISTSTGAVNPYPDVAHAYGGSVRNTTVNLNAVIALKAITQTQGDISGDMVVGLPLSGSGPFKGTISQAGAIAFTVTSNDGSTDTIKFSGTLAKDGSMSGTYSTTTGQGGDFHAAPAINPLVYPLLFVNYSGTFYDEATNKFGILSLKFSSQHQESVSGTYTDPTSSAIPFTGSVDNDNGIQFSLSTADGTITFVGTVNANKSISGTYSTNRNVHGTWNINPI